MTVYIFTKEQLEELLTEQKILAIRNHKLERESPFPYLPEPVTVPSSEFIAIYGANEYTGDNCYEGFIIGANFVLNKLNLKK